MGRDALREGEAALAALPEKMREPIAEMARELAAVPGVIAVVLGGSFARGRARPGSDIDLGLLYADAAPLDVARLRELAARWHDGADPTVTEPYAWGRYVNGGAWLRVDGTRVDWLYRSVEALARTVETSARGEVELDFAQQPPFGYPSFTYLGELHACRPLADPHGVAAALKRRVSAYPEALRAAIAGKWLWAVELNLAGFAPKLGDRADTWGVAACLSRAIFQLAHVRLALARRYPVNDKTLLDEAAEVSSDAHDFAERARAALASLGNSAESLERAQHAVRALFEETAAAAGPLYRSRPKP